MSNNKGLVKGIALGLVGVMAAKMIAKKKGGFNREKFVEKRLSFLDKVRGMSDEDFSQFKQDMKTANCHNMKELKQKYFQKA